MFEVAFDIEVERLIMKVKHGLLVKSNEFSLNTVIILIYSSIFILMMQFK